MDVAGIWVAIATQAGSQPAGAASTDVLHDGILRFREVPLTDLHDWISTSITVCSSTLSRDLFGAFLGISLAEFVGWLLEDRVVRLDPFIDFVDVSVHCERRLDFVATFSRFLPQIFPVVNGIDINFLLAIQSPIFSYACMRHPDSEEVYQTWFRPLLANPETVFREDLPNAMAFFKIMNHAFLQVSVTTSSTNQQDQIFVTAQEETRAAIANIAQILAP
jgi:hypothetical protein